MSFETKRIYPKGDDRLDADKVCYWREHRQWWLYIPGCGAISLKHREVTEHEDKSVTVKGQIKAQQIFKGSKGAFVCGLLQRGVWSDAECDPE